MANVKITQLHELISGMDLPHHRKTSETPENIRWLSKNMGARNSTHKNYDKARELIVTILRESNLIPVSDLKKINEEMKLAA